MRLRLSSFGTLLLATALAFIIARLARVFNSSNRNSNNEVNIPEYSSIVTANTLRLLSSRDTLVNEEMFISELSSRIMPELPPLSPPPSSPPPPPPTLLRFENTSQTPWRMTLADRAARPLTGDLIIFMHCVKTGGGSVYDTLRWFTSSSGNGIRTAKTRTPRWYPALTGGSASFTDQGCGLRAGSAHCDFAELEACLTTDYTNNLPRSATPDLANGGRRLFVTVLRSALSRVRSEYAFACTTKARTRRSDRLINTPTGPRPLLDWSIDLWKAMDMKSCSQPSADAFRAWVEHPDNPAHARYARYLLPHHEPLAAAAAATAAATTTKTTTKPSNSSSSIPSGGDRDAQGGAGHEMLYRIHNCLVGDHTSLVSHWNAWLQPLDAVRGKVLPLAGLMAALNEDARVHVLAERVLRERFWFVAILERLEESYQAFCSLGEYPRCGSFPPRNQGLEHRSGKKPIQPPPEILQLIKSRNALDIRLYDIAVQRLEDVSVSFVGRRRKQTERSV